MQPPRRFNTLRLCAAAFAASSLLLACGGGSGDDPAMDEPVIPAIPAAMHIGAAVNGATIMITKTAEGWWGDNIPPTDDPHAFLTADEDSDSDSAALTDWSWQIAVGEAPKTGATYECGKGEAFIQFGDRTRDAADKPFSTTFFVAGSDNGECTVTIESVSADEISGRFTGTVVKWGDTSNTRAITNGTFRVPAATGPEPG